MEKYLKDIKDNLKKILSEETAQRIFDTNFHPKDITGYVPGEIYTLAELKKEKEGTIVHVVYYDEEGEVSLDDFHPLEKDKDDEEYCVDAYPMPIDHVKDEQLLENIDNDGHSYTVRKAIKTNKKEEKKYKDFKVRKEAAKEITQKLLDLCLEYQNCQDKERKKQIKKEEKELGKQFKKLKVL